MKHIYGILMILIMSTALVATDVSGEVTGFWNAAGNPYNLVGNITVPAGTTLQIQSGVEVYARGNYQISVYGTIQVIGMPADSVRFLNGQTDPNALWGGIRLETTATNSFLFRSYIENAVNGFNTINSAVFINNCRFNKNQKGIHVYGIGATVLNDVIISNNIIERSIENGIFVAQHSSTYIENNEIRYNGTGTQYRGAIQLSNQSTGGSCSPLIQGNHIHHNYKQGITAWDLVGANAIQPEITFNTIEYNLTGIYLLNASGYVADNEIRHNFIPGDSNSGAGVMVAGATSRPYFERNQVYGNYTGFYLGNNAQPVLGDLTIFHAWAQGENSIYDNIDGQGILHSVYCYSYTNPSIVIKAENNYWGAPDAAGIAIGIHDQNDSPALPLVDFDPWIWEVDPMTHIVGQVTYPGSQLLTNYRLQVVSTATGSIILEVPVQPNQDFGINHVITEPFYLIALADVVGGNRTLYGSPGGLNQPSSFTPGDDITIDVDAVLIEDLAPPSREVVGDSYQEGGFTVYPVYHYPFVYAWDYADHLYRNGDYLYLKKHQHRYQGEIYTTEMPENAIWEKVANLNHGDTWSRVEVTNHSGSMLIYVFRYFEYVIPTFGWGTAAVKLLEKLNCHGGMIAKTLQLLDPENPGTYRWWYVNDYVTQHESMQGPLLTDWLSPGNQWHFSSLPSSTAPSYMVFDDRQIYHNPRQVTLNWQAPADDGQHQWTHYRIYNHGTQYAEVPFSQTTWSTDTFVNWENQILTVRATDGVNVSDPTNEVLLMHVNADDHLATPVTISVFPNPFRAASGAVSIRYQGPEQRDAAINIYNLRGQLVHKQAFQTAADSRMTWDGRDAAGRPCAAGVYLMKFSVDGKAIAQNKLLILK